MKPEARREIAQRLVVEAEGLVARQREFIAALQKGHHDTTLSLKLLEQFERAHQQFRRTLALLEIFQP